MYETTEAGQERAKAICSTCDLAAPCLATALQNRERHGVWGGATETERAAILRRSDRAAG
jgi:WhiB family redox-sensing transcriptional regulator